MLGVQRYIRLRIGVVNRSRGDAREITEVLVRNVDKAEEMMIEARIDSAMPGSRPL